MKLWFEGWNVNAHDALPLRRTRHLPRLPPPSAVKIDLADKGRRADSAANNFRQKM
jgi:hypothetical protein